MGKLLTLAQFRKARDEIALQDMTERLNMLIPRRDALYSKYVTLRQELQNATDRNRIDALHYALYIRRSGEFGDAGGIAWQYQQASTQVDDILRDSRYRKAHK